MAVDRRTKAYAATTVSLASTQEDIRKLLKRYGAKGLQVTEQFDPSVIQLRFQVPVESGEDVGLAFVSMDIPTGEGEARNQKQVEQYRRQAGRALYFYLKTQLEAVDFGLVKLEEAFLAHFEVPGYGGTVGSRIVPAMVAALAKDQPLQLLAGK